MSNSIITLFCLIEGETISDAFPVKIPSTDTIADLKELIVSGKQAPAFKDIAPKHLVLWHANQPISATNIDAPILLSKIESPTKLNPFDDVSEIFPDAPLKKTIHILIQRTSLKQSGDDHPEMTALRKQLSELKEQQDKLLDASITVTIVVKGEEKKEISWSTSVDTATLDVFRKRVVAKYPHYANDKSLEIFCSSNGKSTILENDEDLREELKKAKKTPQKTLTVSFGTPSKDFSAWTLKEACLVYNLSNPSNPGFGDFPPFTDIQAATLDLDSEKKALAQLKDMVEACVNALKWRGTNEATKSIVVGMFLVAVTNLFSQDLSLAAQNNIIGRRGHGPVDFSVQSRDNLYTLGVTEVKKQDFDQGVAQNLVQLESALTSNKRKRDEEEQPMVMKTYGIVTDAKTWMFTECTMDQKGNVTFRQSDLEETVNYSGNWQVGVEFVFKRLVWLWSRMVEELPTKNDIDIGPAQKKPRC